jgi:hypothetical protein
VRLASSAAAILFGALAQATFVGAAGAAGPGAKILDPTDRLVTLAAERETSARCRSLAARLRSLAILENNARDAALRDRGARQSERAELRLKRQMVQQSGCGMPMSPSDPRARRCFELKSELRMAEQRARSLPVYGATSSAQLARIRRERQEVAAEYRLSGCPGGHVGN